LIIKKLSGVFFDFHKPLSKQGVNMLPHLQRGIIASAAVTALCVANWASPVVIQVVFVGGLSEVYMSSAFPSDLPHEKFVADTNKGGELPDEDSLQYHLTIGTVRS
jgi:hypothetical protein